MKYWDQDQINSAVREIVRLLDKGSEFENSGKMEEALKTYEEILSLYGDREEEVLVKGVSYALFYKARSLDKLGRFEEELKALNSVIKLVDEIEGLAMEELMAKALIYKGITHWDLKQLGDANKTFDRTIAKFKYRKEDILSRAVAESLFCLGSILRDSGNYEEALNKFDEVFKKYGERTELLIVDTMARTFLKKGGTLEKMNQPAEAVAVFDLLILKYGQLKEGKIPFYVEKGKEKRAEILKIPYTKVAGSENRSNAPETSKDHPRRRKEDRAPEQNLNPAEIKAIKDLLQSGSQKNSSPPNTLGLHSSPAPLIVVVLLLLWALYPHNPYGYYIFLRWVCCPLLAYFAFQSLERNWPSLVWVLGIFALLYNPLFTVHLNRETWSFINLVTIVVLGVFGFFSFRKSVVIE